MAVGVFTTLRVRDGTIWFWPDHVRRLADGAARLGLAPPSAGRLRDEVLASAAGWSDARVRVTLRGDAAAVEASAYAPPSKPWTLRPIEVAAGPVPFKSTERARYEDARARAGGADDALLVDARGRWLECTIANVFVLEADGAVRTPPEDGPLLRGIARGRVLAAARQLGHVVREAPVGPEIVGAAGACFVTNALFVAHPVSRIEGIRAFPPSPLVRRLRETVVQHAAESRIIR